MKRQWLVIPSESQEDGLVEHIDVVPGLHNAHGQALHHGHSLGPACDCRPTILPRSDDILIIVHRSDA